VLKTLGECVLFAANVRLVCAGHGDEPDQPVAEIGAVVMRQVRATGAKADESRRALQSWQMMRVAWTNAGSSLH
jgi:hypothetical protein